MSRAAISISMLCLPMTLAAALLAPPIFGADAGNSPTANKRQGIRDCMSRQMGANKTMSYNAASKICGERFKTPVDAQVASSPAPITRGKR